MAAVFLSFFCVLLSVLCVPTECSPVTSTRCVVPPFLAVGSKPNVLIVIDNSNSMDEDFTAAPVGSYGSSSKSVRARQALIDMIDMYHTQLRIGLMGYKTNNAASYYLFSSQYFASYQPKSYCPNPPSACVSWCQTGDSANRTICQNTCAANNSAFNATYFDETIKYYPTYANNNTSTRARYCALNYPKTLALTNSYGTVYSKGQYAMYTTSSSWSVPYCYSGSSYRAYDDVSNSYTCYAVKTGYSDGNNGTARGYSGSSSGVSWAPTDSDWALGFGNFGRRNTIPGVIGRTWYYTASSSCSNPARGYLYVPVADATQTNSTSTYRRLMYKLATKEGNETGYMRSACYTQSNANTTSTSNSLYYCHIYNSGPTPTWGALNTAYNYFANSLSGRASPITSNCQKNYIVYVTDGLPSVNSTGCVDSRYPEVMMPEVLTQLRGLRSVPYPSGYNSTVLTYVLGVGLSSQAKQRLDQMAGAGGTNSSNNGHAFYADNATQLQDALSKIFAEIGQSVGSAGAVATVSQEINSGDVIVRGAFRAYNASDPDTYTWQGHLESYWPYSGCMAYHDNQTRCESMAGCTYANDNCTGYLYSFQLTGNNNGSSSLFCSDTNFRGGNCTDDGNVLKNQGASNRIIFTSVNGTWKSFEVGNYASLNSLLANTYDFNGTGSGSVTKGDTLALIKWVRGDNSSATSSRNRGGWLLGDIVYSTPVIVSAPSYASTPRTLASAACGDGTCSGSAAKSCFYCYQDTYRYRDQMVYVGANDGMLHGFILGKYSNATGSYVFDPTVNATLGANLGKERWAYIPSNMLSSLQELAKPSYGTTTGCSHDYMVDLSPQSWDVRRYNSTLMYPTWRTILLGGERDAGDVYFSLDVTNPSNGTLVYEHSVLKNFPGPNGTLFGNSTWINRYYDYLKTLSLSRSLPVMARFGTGNSTQYAAISGGGIRDFRPDLVILSSSNSTAKLKNRPGWQYLYYPTFRAVALNGTDLWRSTWKTLLSQSAYRTYFKVDNSTSTTYVKPWAVSNVAAYDVFGANKVAVSVGGTTDGFQDVAYAGDLNGTFYTLVLKGQNSSGPAPRCMMARKVKSIPSTAKANYYRGNRQPITVTPVAAYDSHGNLRIYFGTGKFDNVAGAVYDDKVDNATMTFYCMVENLNSTSVVCSGNSTITSTPIPVYEKCKATSSTHYWVKNSTTPSGDSCFKCSLDLTTPGERLTDSALVAAGYVFFTTFVPDPDVCAPSGTSYLYVVDYECGPLANSAVIGGANAHLNVGSTSWASGGPGTSAVAALKVALGQGMASRPVLDSSGTNLLIQTSENKLIRISVNLTDAERSIIRGWNSGPYSTTTTSP